MPNERQIFVAVPGTTLDEVNCLVPERQVVTSKPVPWYCKYSPPYFILTVSLLELVIFGVATKEISRSFRCDRSKRKEIWRFVTYMFLHNNLFHVILNVVMQCIFAFILEQNQCSVRVGMLYLGSGVVGALTATALRPDIVVGASAGVYALLISHLSRIILNFNSIKHKGWRFIMVTIIVASDVTYYFIHSNYKDNVIISEGAHIGGAISGFLLGLILYESVDEELKTRNKVICGFALILFIISVTTLFIINFQLLFT